ncbi:sigma-54-dependent Fis family transcriptional regulator [Corallococcus exercitus]|uniref:Sigma-54-dependent Fis family transcriptional regulator n=1 Tax=Corallococcus exercitus TaxID=2316736 RepID=A0A3A8I2R5_9BACT|nr:sigma-54 dependent transcriptional regulator [Corallococcus exercitus]NOK31948.1 sigma-54-dependent Fis family transcriptional regulator [Corallococcus exercitus]RKG76996.1 sigma-54-dependent Fis family transcriptional regulator [Corallococcus exercitus]
MPRPGDPQAPVPTADLSTAAESIPRGQRPAARPIPALTLVSHPTAARIGERLLLHGLLNGREVALSRNAPDFTRPGEPLGLPLGDPFMSRKPTLFVPVGEGVRVVPGDEGRCTCAGEPLHGGGREFGPEALASGVPLEFSGRTVVLLHLAPPLEAHAPDTLGMVGQSAALHGLRRHIERVADVDVPVLIRGETGAGKELVAQALHARSRRGGPFISVNLGAIPKELAAAELFGSVRGAFTGAQRDREGFFRAAQGGTLFLDEVGEASPEVQVMLLRVLETGEMYPVGASRPVATDVRLVAATDADLEAQIADGRFRAPLLHRLAGYELRLPPLRERREDIGPLFLHFARQELEALGEAHLLTPSDPYAPPWVPAALAVRLLLHLWPGNIRQLRNVAKQLVIGSRGQPCLELDTRLAQELRLPQAAPHQAPPPQARAPAPEPEVAARRKSTEVGEEELLTALRAHDWDVKKAAHHLGIARSSIYDLIERSPSIRLAGDLSVEELTLCFHACGGNLDEMVRRLEVSRRALNRRVKELGLVPKDA